jgi:hypothetical protein
MALMPKLPTPPAVGDDTRPRSLGDTIITATPVVLTVLATTLAGLSSNSMIQAQFQRSLAAQNQSRAGDQWAYFQAKRIRGVVLTRALDLQSGLVGPVQPGKLGAAAGRLAECYGVGARAAAALKSTAGDNAALRQAAERLAQTASDCAVEASRLQESLAPALARPDVVEAFTYLGSNRLPTAGSSPADEPGIAAALKAAADHKSEDELTLLLAGVTPQALREIVRANDDSARALEDAGKKVEAAFRDVDTAVRAEQALAARFHRAVRAVESAAGGAPAAARPALAAISRANADTQLDLDSLRDYRAARDDYTARREEREARVNQKTAGLYELQVHQSGAESERFRRRSRNFFYGMLCAQAGVAIASFALAGRHKSGMWSAASLAGLIALVFGAYVYLFI